MSRDQSIANLLFLSASKNAQILIDNRQNIAMKIHKSSCGWNGKRENMQCMYTLMHEDT